MPVEQNGGPRNKSMYTGTLDYGKGSTLEKWRKNIFSVNGPGRIGIWGKNSSDLYLTPHIKF